jgi:hypothetical protein
MARENFVITDSCIFSGEMMRLSGRNDVLHAWEQAQVTG